MFTASAVLHTEYRGVPYVGRIHIHTCQTNLLHERERERFSTRERSTTFSACIESDGSTWYTRACIYDSKLLVYREISNVLMEGKTKLKEFNLGLIRKDTRF
jgi:hypothetical protein